MKKAIVFDFFGVIGKSVYQVLFEKIGSIQPANDAKIHDLHKALDNGFLSQDEFLSQYAELAGVSKSEFEDIFHDSTSRFAVSNELIEYINSLKAKCIKIGLLSNVNKEAYEEFIVPILSRINFDNIVLSFEVKLAKPSVEIYELTADRLGVDISDCVMVDDNVENCEGARSAGMDAICYKSTTQFKKDLKIYI